MEARLPVALVQGQAEALALLQGDRMPGPGAGVALRGGPLLGAGVREEQVVRDVLVAGRPLLRQVVGPPEQLQDRPDQILLGELPRWGRRHGRGFRSGGGRIPGRRRRSAGEAAEACHSGVALMPSVRK